MRKGQSLNANAAPRCIAPIYLRDGSGAQCMKHRKAGLLCTQHAKKLAKLKAFERGTAGMQGDGFPGLREQICQLENDEFWPDPR